MGNAGWIDEHWRPWCRAMFVMALLGVIFFASAYVLRIAFFAGVVQVRLAGDLSVAAGVASLFFGMFLMALAQPKRTIQDVSGSVVPSGGEGEGGDAGGTPSPIQPDSFPPRLKQSAKPLSHNPL